MKGSIRKIRLQNFMTYNDVVLQPGPRLNLILGPNGTGKSALMCGMCLGLAGKLTTIGRASHAVEYIKYEMPWAKIEITLDNGTGGKCVIERVISRTKGDNRFSINGKHATQKDVEAKVLDMHIQVNNLCQFLPQEKVADFAKMSPDELLDNTQKAVGDNEMVEAHQHLKTARTDAVKLTRDHASLEDRLSDERQKNERMIEDVKSFEERAKNLQMIDDLKLKIPVVKYNIKRKEHFAVKNQQAEKQAAINKIEKELGPMNKEREKLTASGSKIQEQIKSKEQTLNSNDVKAKNQLDQMEQESDTIKDIEEEFNMKLNQEATRKKNIQDLEQQMTSLQEELVNMPVGDVQPQIEVVNQKMLNVKGQLTEIQNTGQLIQMDVQGYDRALREKEQDLQELQNTSKMRLDSLRQRHKDTYEAVLWLRQNTHRFAAQIHEPMFLNLNVTEPQYAKYVETHIPWNDMRAFVCENSADSENFIRLVKHEQNLRVNVVNVPPRKVFQPTVPLRNLGRYGFQTYMREVMICHEAVMLYNCTLHRVHDIPIGSATTNKHVKQIIEEQTKIRRFFTDNNQYNISRSRYTNEPSTRNNYIQDAKYLNITVDLEKIRMINQELQGLKKEQSLKKQEYTKLQDQSKKLESTLNDLRVEKRNLIKSKEARGTLTARINNIQANIKHRAAEVLDVEAKRTRVRGLIGQVIARKANIKRRAAEVLDVEAERARVRGLIGQVIARKAEHILKHCRFVEICMKLGLEKTELALDYTHICQDIAELESKSEQQLQVLNELQKENEEIKQLVVQTKADAKYLLEKSREATGHLSPEKQDLMRAFPDTLEELEALINDYQLRADTAMTTDQKVIQQYYVRKANIENMEKQLLKSTKDIAGHKAEMATARDQWLTPLNELLARINENFAMFFSMMKCSGEVVLDVPENKEDYGKYGIKIRVKFRDSETLKDLNAQTQSGGERSVATVMYMMALQEITVCPFRCVDEINQGMDPTNERRVFDVIFKTVCERNSSQYFLLTPKLLKGLEYPRNVNVITIFNGERRNLSADIQTSIDALRS